MAQALITRLQPELQLPSTGSRENIIFIVLAEGDTEAVDMQDPIVYKHNEPVVFLTHCEPKVLFRAK